MNYKELKAYIEILEETQEAEVKVNREGLIAIAKEALNYRKKNALNKKTKIVKN